MMEQPFLGMQHMHCNPHGTMHKFVMPTAIQA